LLNDTKALLATAPFRATRCGFDRVFVSLADCGPPGAGYCRLNTVRGNFGAARRHSRRHILRVPSLRARCGALPPSVCIRSSREPAAIRQRTDAAVTRDQSMGNGLCSSARETRFGWGRQGDFNGISHRYIQMELSAKVALWGHYRSCHQLVRSA